MAGKMWTKDQIRTLIEIYREEPCLYAIKHPHYRNKKLRYMALERVASVVREFRPNVTAKECQAKIHILRNQFNVENVKRRSSLNKSENGADDVYIPSLWYFDMLSFLDEYYAPRKNKPSRIGITIEEEKDPLLICSTATTTVQANVFSPNKRKRMEFISSENGELCSVSNITNSEHDANKEDEWDVFAKFISCELRNLSEKRGQMLKRDIIKCVWKYQDLEDD